MAGPRSENLVGQCEVVLLLDVNEGGYPVKAHADKSMSLHKWADMVLLYAWVAVNATHRTSSIILPTEDRYGSFFQ